MKKSLLIILISAIALIAQSKNEINLSGNLNIDSRISFINSNKFSDEKENSFSSKKTPLLAGVMSFAVPGAGQFYNEQYIKSAAFIAVEAAAIVVAIMYNQKGDDQTVFFENYANQHWSVGRYALWTIKNAKTINAGVDVNGYKVFDNNGKVNWAELNRLETAIGSFYSHRLAPLGDQQYYEMIGKYPQFNTGWDDFGDENKPYIYGDPLTANFLYYSKERGKANDFYNIASKAVIVVVTNHLISAIEAAWSASRINKSLQVSANLQKFEIGYSTLYYPQLNLQYSF